jgi:hypothetical protein
VIVSGNYILNIKIGDVIIPIEPQKIEEFTITQDIDRLLPVFRLRVADPTNALAHVIPFDKISNSIGLEIARGSSYDNLNEFKFVVKRRQCLEDNKYEIAGILDVDGLLSPERCRSLTGNLKTSLEDIASEELEITDLEVGTSLNYDKIVLQPHWTNAKLLGYLTKNVIGIGNEAGYHCFIKNVKGKTTFVFKSLNEMYLTPIKYKFIVGPDTFQNHYPILAHRIYDNSGLITDYGAKSQTYNYFDYDTGKYVNNSISVDDFQPSLTKYLLINDDDTCDRTPYSHLGRSNRFTSDFEGRVRNNYYNRLGQLINMWASTYGLENIAPGDIVQVIFGEMLHRKDLFIYQHSGLWMVKRVVHLVGQSFLTNLLLVRSGIDTEMDTSLMKASAERKL